MSLELKESLYKSVDSKMSDYAKMVLEAVANQNCIEVDAGTTRKNMCNNLENAGIVWNWKILGDSFTYVLTTHGEAIAKKLASEGL